jgi:hypothetical protein
MPRRGARTAGHLYARTPSMKQCLVSGAIMIIQRSITLAIMPAGGCAEALAADSEVERGKYLVTLGSCNDCHMPGYFFGKPDFSRALSGSDVGFAISGPRRVRRPQPHAGQRDQSRQLDGRPDHFRLHCGHPTRRPLARADPALRGTFHLSRRSILVGVPTRTSGIARPGMEAMAFFAHTAPSLRGVMGR